VVRVVTDGHRVPRTPEEYEALGGVLWHEARFIREYLSNGFNVRAAMAKAGYRVSAPSPFKNERIREVLRSEFLKQAERAGIDPAAILAKLGLIALAPLDDPHVRVPEQVKALELLGKHFRLFDANVNVHVGGRVTTGVSLCLEDLTEDELLQLERIGRHRKTETPLVSTNGSGLPSASSNGRTSTG
jgi:hypothetical protein